MNRISMVIGMMLAALCLTGCGGNGAPSTSLVKNTIIAEKLQDRYWGGDDYIAVPMVSSDITESSVTSNPQETFYNFTVRVTFERKFPSNEVDVLYKKIGIKAETPVSYKSIQQYNCEFVQRRGEWFHTIEKPQQISGEFISMSGSPCSKQKL